MYRRHSPQHHESIPFFRGGYQTTKGDLRVTVNFTFPPAALKSPSNLQPALSPMSILGSLHNVGGWLKFFFFVSLFHVLFRDLTYPQDGPVHDWHWNRLLLYAPVHHMMCPGALQALKETIHARFSSFLASCDSANEESRHPRHTVQTFFLSLLCRKISLVRIS